MIKRYKHQPLLGYVPVDNVSDHRGLVCDSAQVHDLECKLEESVILCAELHIKNVDKMLRIDKIEDDLVISKSELHSACEKLEKSSRADVDALKFEMKEPICAECTQQELEYVWEKTEYMEVHRMPTDDMRYIGLDRGILFPLSSVPNGVKVVTIDELVAEAGK